MMDIKGALTRQLGPLPTWAWGVVVGGGYLLYHYLKTGSLFGSSSSSGDTTASVVPVSDASMSDYLSGTGVNIASGGTSGTSGTSTSNTPTSGDQGATDYLPILSTPTIPVSLTPTAPTPGSYENPNPSATIAAWTAAASNLGNLGWLSVNGTPTAPTEAALQAASAAYDAYMQANRYLPGGNPNPNANLGAAQAYNTAEEKAMGGMLIPSDVFNAAINNPANPPGYIGGGEGYNIPGYNTNISSANVPSTTLNIPAQTNLTLSQWEANVAGRSPGASSSAVAATALKDYNAQQGKK